MDRRSLLWSIGAGIVGKLFRSNKDSDGSLLQSSQRRTTVRSPGKSVLILGAGFGGLTTAIELRHKLGREHTITLVDRQPKFLMGFRKLWIVAGMGTRAAGERSIASLNARGINVRQATIYKIDTGARTVQTDSGNISYDYLVIALGAEPRPDLVPGFSESAFNLYDPTGAERLAARVESMARGRVVIGIAGIPYKCPPAPYECAMLLDEVFRKRGVRSAIEIRIFSVQPMSLPVLSGQRCDEFEQRLTAKEILFEAKKKLVKLDGTRVVFADRSLEADLLVIVPPHRPPAVVKESGITGSGDWIPVDRGTLRAGPRGVYAIGDVTDIPLANKISLPKAGIFAEAEGKVVAAEIAAEILGKPAPGPFDGRGYCFVEHGFGKAALIQGEFFADVEPNVQLLAPTAEDYRKKLDFERERLRAWFS